MGTRISVFNSKELQGTILLMKALPREVAKEIRAQNKTVILPAWQEAVSKHATTKLEKEVLSVTARVAISDQNVTLSSASVGRSLAGGGKPAVLAAGTEFGSKRFKQFKARRRQGYVVMQAAADVIPRIASLWVQTTVRTFYEQLEKGK